MHSQTATGLILQKLDALSDTVQALLSTPTRPYLTPEEVSEYANVSRDTVLRWIRRREIKAVKHDRLLRIHRDELAKFLKKRTR